MRSSAEHNRINDPVIMRLQGAIRRMAISVTSRVLWQLSGFRNVDGTTESTEAEPFTGIGFYSIPPGGGAPEAITVMVGGGNSPAIVATRDEKTRATIAKLAADETAVFTSKAIIVIKANGTVEIRSKDGTAVPLATKADIDALISTFNAHIHAASGLPTTIPCVMVPNPAYPDPMHPEYLPTIPQASGAGPANGTHKLRAE